MKIFISSTYEDLKEHRRAVIDAILQLREQPIAMENFGAHPTEPKSAALAEIADCDAFVGIYAHRYHWVPDSDERSIAEQEFDYARDRSVRCFCYRVQKDFAWDAKFIETGAQADRLQKFLTKIGKLVTWEEFTTPDDLAKKVVADLARELHAGYAHFSALHSIPPPPLDFTGRAEQFNQLVQNFGVGATISGLTGMGGIGKTALALAAAHQLAPQFPDAQIFVDCHGNVTPPRPPTELMREIIYAFTPTADLRQAKDDEIAAQYRNVLYDKRALILLDNAAGAAQVKPLIPPPPGALLVTSRQRFALPGLRAVPLNVMPPTDACDLLMKIAPHVNEYADEIAKLCGYLPLALRIAGSFLVVHVDASPKEYTARLQDRNTRLKMLKSEDDPELNVEAAFELSYELLPPEAQVRWRALAVFPAPFDAPAVADVWAMGKEQALKPLGDLLRASLLDYNKEKQRYYLHDLLSAFADKQLLAEERFNTRLRHSAHYLQIALTTHEGYLQGGERLFAALKLFDDEWLQIWAGQEWAAANRRLDKSAARFCADYPLDVRYCLPLRVSSQEQARWWKAGLDAARRIKDRKKEGTILTNLGLVYEDLGNARRAIECHKEYLSMARESGDHRGESGALNNLGSAYIFLGKPRLALKFFRQALVIKRRLKPPDRRSEAISRMNIGEAIILMNTNAKPGNSPALRKAIAFLLDALAIFHDLGESRYGAMCMTNLAKAYLALKKPERAMKYCKQALDEYIRIGSREGEADTSYVLSLVKGALGDHEQAIAYAETAVEIFKGIKSPYAERAEKHAKKLKRQLTSPSPK